MVFCIRRCVDVDNVPVYFLYIVVDGVFHFLITCGVFQVAGFSLSESCLIPFFYVLRWYSCKNKVVAICLYIIFFIFYASIKRF